MSHRAKLFKSGGSQAVCLPREYPFEGQEEVLVYRQCNRVILEPGRRTRTGDLRVELRTPGRAKAESVVL